MLRIMLDTNVLLSALLFPGQRMDAVIEKIMAKYQLVCPPLSLMN